MSICVHKTYSVVCNECGQPYRNYERFADYNIILLFATKDGWNIFAQNGERGLNALITLCPECVRRLRNEKDKIE